MVSGLQLSIIKVGVFHTQHGHCSELWLRCYGDRRRQKRRRREVRGMSKRWLCSWERDHMEDKCLGHKKYDRSLTEHTSRQKRRNNSKRDRENISKSPHGRIQGDGAESTQQKKPWHKRGKFILTFVDILAWPHLSYVCQRESSGLRFWFWTQVKTGFAWALLRHAGFHSSCSFMTAAITAIQIKYYPSFYLTPAIRGKCQSYLDSSHSGFITQGSVNSKYESS